MKNTVDRVNFVTGEVETVNKGFTQLYDKHAALIMEIADSPTAMKMFVWLITHMDKRNILVVSQATLAEAIKCSERTIRNATTELKERKVLTVIKVGNANAYAVNADIAWKDTADNKKHAQFEAVVFVSSSEQSDDFRTQLMGHAIKKKPSSTKRQKTLDNVVGIGGSAALMTVGIFSLLELLLQS